MKIAFSGASSTGKTSVSKKILSRIEKKIPKFRLLNVDARSILDLFPNKSVSAIDADIYRLFQSIYVGQKLHAETGEDAFLTERSFLDCLAFWKIHCQQYASSSESAVFENICTRHARNYDITFFFPTGLFSVRADGYRNISQSYHEEFQAVLLGIFKDQGTMFVDVPAGSVEERSNFVWRTLYG